jgi:hypothetical protein
MEDHAEQDLQATAALLNLERKAKPVSEARDRLVALLGAEPEADMLAVLTAACKALETLTAALELQTEGVAA